MLATPHQYQCQYQWHCSRQSVARADSVRLARACVSGGLVEQRHHGPAERILRPACDVVDAVYVRVRRATLSARP